MGENCNCKSFRVPPEAAGLRLDRWLALQLPEASRTQIQAWIRAGRVHVHLQAADSAQGSGSGSGVEVKPSLLLVGGECVRVSIPPVQEARVEPEPLPLEILYEDDDLIAVNKPSGWVVYPAPGNPRGTLINGLLHHTQLASIGAPVRPGIVHRLDKGTSGVLVVAKTDEAHRDLVRQFKRREVDKTYLAWVWGQITEDEGRIEAPIGRDPGQRKRMAAVATGKGGKPAITEFTVRQRRRDQDQTLVEAHPLTGRTHQIRVHFSLIGHPVVGDPQYGPRRHKHRAGRLMLHAWVLKLWHPRTGERLILTAPLPEDFMAGRRESLTAP